ncbi:MAG: ATP-dependent zinc protease [Verrucomicrobiota bacterium]
MQALHNDMTTHGTIIGWKESVALPDWGIEGLRAKADTGARRSAIDVKHLRELPDGRIEFDIVLDRRRPDETRRIVSEVSHVTHVRSSNGQQHERYFVTTRLRLGGREKLIELSLVNRREMVCRMLLGRKALEGDYLVDSSRTYVLGPRKRAKATVDRTSSKPKTRKRLP